MSLKDTCVSLWESISVQMGAGASITDKIDCGGLRLFGVDVPASWTMANLTVYQKHADGTYKPVEDGNGGYLTITVANAGSPIRVSNPAQFSALTDIKLLSGTPSTPVAQAADRTLTLILRSI